MGSRERITRLFGETTPMENMFAEKRVRHAALSGLSRESKAFLFSATEQHILFRSGNPSPQCLSADVISGLIADHDRRTKLPAGPSCDDEAQPPLRYVAPMKKNAKDKAS